MMRIPEIPRRLIRLFTILPLLLNGSQTFHFLVSPPRGLGALAPNKDGAASDQADKLKVVHMYLNISSKSEMPVRLGPKLETA